MSRAPSLLFMVWRLNPALQEIIGFDIAVVLHINPQTHHKMEFIADLTNEPHVARCMDSRFERIWRI